MCLAKYLELNRTPHVIATRLRNAHDETVPATISHKQDSRGRFLVIIVGRVHNNFLHFLQDGCCVRFVSLYLWKIMRYFIAYKRLPGPTTSKTLVSTPALFPHRLIFSQTNPKAKIISMTVAFGRR
jgi:hypothetical protein